MKWRELLSSTCFFVLWSTLSLTALSAAALPAASPPDVVTDGAEKTASATRPSPITANLTLTSHYVSRGFRQTWGDPALQGGLDYVRPDGFFAGTWLSNVNRRYIENGTLEWDLYGGYAGAAGAFGYSTTVFYYKYPGARVGSSPTNYDYGELSLGLTYQFLYAKYNYTYTRDFFGIADARGTGYLDLGANYPLGAGYVVHLHYGVGRVASTRAADNAIWNWKDGKVGISKAFSGGWTLAGAYTKAQGATAVYDRFTTGVVNAAGVAETSNPAAGTFLLSLNKTF